MKDIDKNKIIDITINEINKNGYENISLRKITEELDITTGTFYKRFKDKNDLFLNTAEHISSDMFENIYSKIKDYEIDPKRSLINLGIEVIKLFNNKKNLTEFLFFNSNVLSAYTNKNLGKRFKLLNITKKIIYKCINDDTKVDYIFIQLWSFIQGYGHLISNKVCALDISMIENTLNKLIGSDKNE